MYIANIKVGLIPFRRLVYINVQIAVKKFMTVKPWWKSEPTPLHIVKLKYCRKLRTTSTSKYIFHLLRKNLSQPWSLSQPKAKQQRRSHLVWCNRPTFPTQSIPSPQRSWSRWQCSSRLTSRWCAGGACSRCAYWWRVCPRWACWNIRARVIRRFEFPAPKAVTFLAPKICPLGRNAPRRFWY